MGTFFLSDFQLFWLYAREHTLLVYLFTFLFLSYFFPLYLPSFSLYVYTFIRADICEKKK